MRYEQAPKLPREVRMRMYLQVDRGRMPVRDACDTFGVSRKTYHKWWNRDHGFAPPRKPRRPHPATKLAGTAAEFVLREKAAYGYGPRKMAIRLLSETGLSVSPNAVYRFCLRKGLVRRRPKAPP